MSNTFNSDRGRAKISSLFGKNLTDKPVELQLFPDQIKAPEDDVTTPKQLAKMLRDNKITIFAANMIPALREIPTSSVFGENITGAEDEPTGVPTTLSLPIDDVEFLPKYYPRHQIVPYDQVLLGQILYQTMENDYDTDTFNTYVDVVKTYVYSSGTYTGQVNRLKKIYAVANGTDGNNRNKNLDQQGYSLEQAATLLDRYLPMSVLTNPIMPLSTFPSMYLDLTADPIVDYIPYINLQAAAGVPYVGKTKQDTLFECIAIADSIVKQTSEALNRESEDAAKDVMKDNWWVGLSLMVPKGERYKVDELLSKTRNIFAVTAPANLLGSIVATPLLNSNPINSANSETPSLYKFNPFHGNLNTVIMKLLRPGNHALVYADNFYLSYERTDSRDRKFHDYYSVDLVKGEANATPSHVQAVAFYLLTRGYTDGGWPNFNLTWATIALLLCPIWFCNAPALLMNMQIRIPGQLSGQAWTFITNHLLSSIIVDYWLQHPVDPETPEFMALRKKFGVDFTFERTIKDLEGSIENLKASTPDQGIMSVSGDKLRHDLPTLDLDMLGWSAVWSTKHNILLPILEKIRLFKTLALPKKTFDKDENERPNILKPVYQVVRMESAIMVGAWAFPVLLDACTAISSSNRLRVKKSVFATSKYAAIWAENCEFREVIPDVDLESIDGVTIASNLAEPESPKQYDRLLPPIEWDKYVRKCFTGSTRAMIRGVLAGGFLEAKARTIQARERLKQYNKVLDSGLDPCDPANHLDWAAETEAQVGYDKSQIDEKREYGDALTRLTELAHLINTTQPVTVPRERERDYEVAANPLPAKHYPIERHPVGAYSNITGQPSGSGLRHQLDEQTIASMSKAKKKNLKNKGRW